MKTVWKYTIDLRETTDPILAIPRGAQFLHLKDQEYDRQGFQNDPYKVNLIDTWWGVNTDVELVPVQLHIRGTGEDVPSNVNYLGTFFPIPGIVMHLFQKDPEFQDLEIVDGKFVPKSQ